MTSQTQAPPRQEYSDVVEHLFRQESGKLIAVLTRVFGVHNLTLVEDVVQEALVRALQTWPYYGVPDNPAGWLMRTARNLAIDVVRRESNFREKEPQVTALMEDLARHPGDADLACETELKDNTLRLIFACCHPVVPQEAQIALALKTLCGFGTVEIARAFLATEASIDKRITRAKQKIREAGVRFEIPAGEELARRLESVLQTLYLLFNEGYNASTGDRLIKDELCREAIRLAEFLGEHPAGNQPRTHALAALMLFHAARLPGRTDAAGNILRLEDQDRSSWDQRLAARGMLHLGRSASGDQLSAYHLEAGIAACHTAAADYGSTDWPRILALYDRLMSVDGSSVVALNRAVAVSHVHGADAGLAAVQGIGDRGLETYYLFHAVMGDLEARRNRFDLAAEHFRRAMALTELEAERTFLNARIGWCAAQEGLQPASVN